MTFKKNQKEEKGINMDPFIHAFDFSLHFEQ